MARYIFMPGSLLLSTLASTRAGMMLRGTAARAKTMVLRREIQKSLSWAPTIKLRPSTVKRDSSLKTVISITSLAAWVGEESVKMVRWRMSA